MKPIITEITDQWIKEKQPCSAALDWWDKKERNPIAILNKLIAEKHYDWANWFIVRIMEKHDYISYAIFAAEQVIDIYEKKYPDDKRPRLAIEAAKNYLNNPSNKNASAYAAAASADAADAASAAASAAYAAAASAASADAASASAAYAAAASAAYTYTVYAAYAARQEMRLKILNYGMELLKK